MGNEHIKKQGPICCCIGRGMAYYTIRFVYGRLASFDFSTFFPSFFFILFYFSLLTLYSPRNLLHPSRCYAVWTHSNSDLCRSSTWTLVAGVGWTLIS